MIVTGVAVPNISKANGPGHLLKLTVAVGCTSKAIERMIGDIQLHYSSTELLEPWCLGRDAHPVSNWRRARRRSPSNPLDLDKTQPARPEGLEAVGRAQLRHVDTTDGGCPHDRRACWNTDINTIDLDMHDGL
jgi:hypothetical protein